MTWCNSSEKIISRREKERKKGERLSHIACRFRNRWFAINNNDGVGSRRTNQHGAYAIVIVTFDSDVSRQYIFRKDQRRVRRWGATKIRDDRGESPSQLGEFGLWRWLLLFLDTIIYESRTPSSHTNRDNGKRRKKHGETRERGRGRGKREGERGRERKSERKRESLYPRKNLYTR